ncbi:MAG: response regulator [Actinobacteria bacterium]|nr:response regulator [Actinomycetota bacterium]
MTGGRRVLVIDDEEHIREVARASLELVAGWDVLTAGNGPDGIALAEAEQPDAILLDVMMPEMDGPTTFARLQGNGATRHIPVILLTAKMQGSERRRFEQLGVASVQAKPFDPVRLADTVARTLGWPA